MLHSEDDFGHYFAGSVVFSHELPFQVRTVILCVCIAFFKSGVFLFLSEGCGILHLHTALTAVSNYSQPSNHHATPCT